MNISAAILSRFDLLFILLDQNNEDTDRMLAHHIVKVHQRKEQALDPPYSTATLQRYLKAGKALKPQVLVLIQRFSNSWKACTRSSRAPCERICISQKEGSSPT